jgi:lipopolysaccharide transport system permease protein
VFSSIFQARWGADTQTSTIEFALILFSGLLLFNLFADCISRAPSLVIRNANFVKKVIFPLEILPVVDIAVATFHWTLGLLVWILFYVIFVGLPHITVLWLPVVIMPVLLNILGIAWFIASLGVYLRDVSQIIGVIVSALMFLSPVFYPLSAIPEQYRNFLFLNPLTLPIEQIRGLMYWGSSPDLLPMVSYSLVALLVCFAGRYWFERMRRGFADVL